MFWSKIAIYSLLFMDDALKLNFRTMRLNPLFHIMTKLDLNSDKQVTLKLLEPSNLKI